MSFDMPPITSDAVRNLLHALAVSWGLAAIGRLAYHVVQVRAKKRSFFGWELLYELPTAAFCGIVTFGLADMIGVTGFGQAAMISFMAYLGPRGLEEMFIKVVDRYSLGRGKDL